MEEILKDVEMLIENIRSAKEKRRAVLIQIAEKDKIIQETEDPQVIRKLLDDIEQLQLQLADSDAIKAQVRSLMEFSDSRRCELLNYFREITKAADNLKLEWLDLLIFKESEKTKH